MTTTVIEQVSEARERRERDRMTSWRTLVRDAISGDFDPEHILGRLEALDKTEADLAEAIERYQRRQDARQRLEEIPTHRRHLAEVRQQIAQANAELEQAKQRHQGTVAPLLGRQAELTATIATEAELRQVLLRTAPQELLDELQRAEQRAESAAIRIAPLRSSLDDLRQSIRGDERRLAHAREHTITAESDRGIKAQEADLARAKARLCQAERELAEAQAAEANAREAVELATRKAIEA